MKNNSSKIDWFGIVLCFGTFLFVTLPCGIAMADMMYKNIIDVINDTSLFVGISLAGVFAFLWFLMVFFPIVIYKNRRNYTL